MLQLAHQELEAAIETELAENPALERLEEAGSGPSSDEIMHALVSSEPKFRDEDRELHRSLPSSDEETDWTDYVASRSSLRDHLVAQLLPRLPNEQKYIGLYLCECVNSKGYLEQPTEEIALALECSIEEVERIIQLLQHCEPPGIGAKDIRECLLLQLRNAQSLEQRLGRSIIRTAFEDFLAQRTMKLSRRFGVMPDVIEHAFAEIKLLNPFPGENFTEDNCGGEAKAQRVVAELALQRTDAGWSVEVRGPEPSSLRVSPSFQSSQVRICNGNSDSKRHVSFYIHRAKDFIAAIEQRRITMRRIGEYLLQKQAGFVSTGQYEFLVPLTRTQMALDLGLHESTISRATADKFVEIGTGENIPFEVFFKPALRVRKMIEDIVSTENPGNPMSDETITQLLAERGVIVARRTVNKYRDRNKLLSSRKRRTA